MTQKTNESENLSRIKDILFGEDFQGLEKQFILLKEESKKSYDELNLIFEKRFESLEQKLIEKINEITIIHNDINKEQQILKDEIKTDITKVNDEQLKESDKIEKIIIQKQQDFNEQISIFENKINENIAKILKETSLKYEKLNTTKINREVFADMLTELSEKLKK